MGIETALIIAAVSAAGAIGSSMIQSKASDRASKAAMETQKMAMSSNSNSKTAPQSTTQMLAGDPNILSNQAAETSTLNGRSRLLGN